MLASRRRRGGQRGQTLILALGFVAFFGVVIVAVLRVADVPGLQHGRTEATAVSDSVAEGGAAYAAADAGRTDLALSCAPGATGGVTMQGGDTATYSVNACISTAGTGSGQGPGLNCLLCVLNQVPNSAPTNVVLNLHCAQCSIDVQTSGGDDYINGSIAAGSSLTACATTCPSSGAHIRLIQGATNGCICSPAATTFAPAIADPLASVAPPSPAATGQPSGCTAIPGATWNAANGCSATITSSVTINPGLWAQITTSGQPTITMNPGVYAFTGPLNVSGQAAISGSGGVTFFLTCPGYGTSGALCPTAGHTGGSLSLTGQGALSFTAPSSGQYKGISVLADPHVLDPGGAASCAGGAAAACLLETGGNGASISGTVDTRSGGVELHGNGGDAITGRLITNSLDMSVSGRIGSALILQNGGQGVSTSTCGVLDATVGGSAGSTSSTGRAIVQSQCGTAGSQNGVVDFNYKQ